VAVFVTDVMTGSTSANDSAMQRAPSGPARFGKRVETKPGETVIEELRSGSRITLRGDSRLTYSPIVLSLGATRYVALDGEAAFEISPTEDPVEVHTWAGKLFLERGSYAVRCAPGCSAMLVTVGAGLAAIRGDTAKPAMLLKPGDYGRVRRGGEPEKVSAGVDAWPALEKGRSKP
jgi:ferric-dicitrate binding protein FerR (iron transport regulator)